jgi:hypothetical protein
LCLYHSVGAIVIDNDFAFCETPNVFIEGFEFFAYLNESLSVTNHCLNLSFRLNDARILHNSFNVAVGKLSNFHIVEVDKTRPKNLPLHQH